MGLVFAFFVVALCGIAWRTDDTRLRWWLLAFAALNAVALAVMVIENDPHLLKLLPADEGPPDPAWRR